MIPIHALSSHDHRQQHSAHTCSISLIYLDTSAITHMQAYICSTQHHSWARSFNQGLKRWIARGNNLSAIHCAQQLTVAAPQWI